MSLSSILIVCTVVYLIVILVELAFARRIKRFLWELGALLITIILALLVTNSTTGIVSFGAGTSPVTTVGWMLVATILGITARYVFYLRGKFSWLGMLKPVTISPIVLLPLIGSVQGLGDLKDMQVMSFAFLAFQNGFFWQSVLDSAKPITDTPRLEGKVKHA